MHISTTENLSHQVYSYSLNSVCCCDWAFSLSEWMRESKGGLNVWVYGQNPAVWPFKWNLFAVFSHGIMCFLAVYKINWSY